MFTHSRARRACISHSARLDRPLLAYYSQKRRLPTSTLFPYTTLFRSARAGHEARAVAEHVHAHPLLAQLVHLPRDVDRKSTRLNSSHRCISYAVFCLKKKKIPDTEVVCDVNNIPAVTPHANDSDRLNQ